MDGQNQFPTGAPEPQRFEPGAEISTQAPVRRPIVINPPAPVQPQAVQQPQNPVAPTDDAHFYRETDPGTSGVDASSQPSTQSTTPSQELSWQAHEFAAQSKSSSWYIVLVLVSILGVIIAYIVSHDLITVVAVVVCASLFAYVAGRDPRQLQYGLGPRGISIGNKFYPYGQFSAFSIVEEINSLSINFMPLKRFAPMLTIAYNAEDEPAILGLLAQHLPYADHKRTLTDDLMRRIHF